MKSISRIFIALVAIIIYSPVLKSQDTLYLKSGQKVASKVLEITPSEIKYKKTDNPDGPTFITNSTDISIIKYQNGTIDTVRTQQPATIVKTTVTPLVPKEVDPHPPIYRAGLFYKYDGRRIKANEMHDILAKVNDPEINMHIKKAKTAKGLEYVGYLGIPTIAFGAGYLIYAAINNIDATGAYVAPYAPGVISTIIAAGCLATSITFKIKGKQHNKAAVDMYNEKY